MKIELGKTKIRGFKFNHLTEGVVWDKQIEKYIDKEGVIMSIHHEHIYQSMRVKFEDGNSYAYPLEMAKQYIVKEETVFYSIGVPYNKLFVDFNPKGCGIIEEIKDIFTKHQNKNNMKNLKITAPEGYEIDKVKSTFENIVFKPIKKELPKSWIELIEVHGYSVYDIKGAKANAGFTSLAGKNIFATKEQAEASLALAQLSQLREVYRDGWKPDWNDRSEIKHCLYFFRGVIDRVGNNTTQAFLSFQSEEVRDLFLENFRDLIEQAKPLMS